MGYELIHESIHAIEENAELIQSPLNLFTNPFKNYLENLNKFESIHELIRLFLKIKIAFKRNF